MRKKTKITVLCQFNFILFVLLLLSLTNITHGNKPIKKNGDPSHIIHAVTNFDTPKYPKDFPHLDYVNPNAPKGGHIKLGTVGSFDSLNGFINKGIGADGLGLIYDTLTMATLDEPFTRYGLIAERIELAEDRSWVIFHLNPLAKFSDGHPITATDVVFTFELLMKHGRPMYQYYYQQVKQVIALDPQKVKFTFNSTTNRELPLIVGEFPILPKHFWENKDFSDSGLIIPIGSGPYYIESFNTGRYIRYRRNPEYWAHNLPIQRGRNNFEKISYEYYLDNTVALEAFKAGEYHLRLENNSKFWATLYQGPAFDTGEINVKTIPHKIPAGMQGFAFNLRKPLFQDLALRQAISFAFDFEWSNKHLFYDQYKRTRSYFENTDLAATELPSDAEVAILKPFKAQLSDAVFNEIYQPPKTKGSGKARANLRKAQKILKNSGYKIVKKQLVDPNNQPIVFEFLITQEGFERIILPFNKNLEILGIKMSVRKVDVTQYTERLRHFDFDMIVTSIGQTLSPGNEQINYWHSSSADVSGSRNLMGIKNPVIDHLVTNLIHVQNRSDLITYTRALDRVLQWQYFIIPNWHINSHRIAYWQPLSHPEVIPPYGLDIFSWWLQPE